VAASDTADNPIRVHNGVAAEDLEEYIEAHKRIRPSAALFIDKQCVFTGTIQEDKIALLTKEIAALTWVVDIVTKPYR